ADAWGKVRRWLQRRFGERVSYTWVRELGAKTARLHLHVVASLPYVPQRVLAAACSRYGFGYVTDIRKVRNQAALSYLAKYLGKSNRAMPRFARRVQSSTRTRPSSPCERWEYLPLWRWHLRYEERRQSEILEKLAQRDRAGGEGQFSFQWTRSVPSLDSLHE